MMDNGNELLGLSESVWNMGEGKASAEDEST